MAQILIVLTSHYQLGDTGKPTGFWMEELAAPYYIFTEAGHSVVLASLAGGLPPLDPLSQESENLGAAGERFLGDKAAMMQLAATTPLADISADNFDAVFYPGGHGPMWDLAESPHSIDLIETMLEVGKPVAAVCHGPAVFRHARNSLGESVVANKEVTSFSNAEEMAVDMHTVVPYLLEDELIRLGASYQCTDPWAECSVIDGNLITGQNPASSGSTAHKVLSLLEKP